MRNWMRLLVMAVILGAAASTTSPTLAQEQPPADLPTTSASTTVNTAGCDYVVKPGDTLWSIAQSLRNNPYAYRSLWSINNAEVTNPHYIYPGQCLNFTRRSGLAGPIGYGPSPIAVDGDPEEAFVSVSETWESLFSCEVPIPFTSTELVYPSLAPAFIATEEHIPIGELVAARENKDALSEGDVVFLRLQNLQDVKCGDIFTLYEPQGPLEHPLSRKTVLGYSYQIVGEVKIRTIDEQSATAEIVTAFQPIRRKALVAERVPVRAMLRLKVPDAELDGFIVGRLDSQGEAFFQDEVIFLDRGRRDQVKSGDRFWVVRRGDEFDPDTKNDPTLPEYVVGKAVVFSAGEFMSTAILVDQDRPLQVGDQIVSHLEKERSKRR